MNDFLKNNYRGIIATVLFHGIIAVIFILFGFTAPPTEFPDPEGIVIDFGTSDNGLGEIEPETNESNNATVNNSSTEENYLTQDTEETVSVESSETTSTESTEQETENNEVEEPEREVDTESLYHGDNNSSEGNTEGDGNMGDPDGGNSDNYNGGPGGNGISYSLSGRSPVGQFPKPKYPPGNVFGKVVVNIKVDKYGTVIRVSLGKGTTATDQDLIKAAKQAAWKAKFDKDFNSIEQTGTITYNFNLQ